MTLEEQVRAAFEGSESALAASAERIAAAKVAALQAELAHEVQAEATGQIRGALAALTGAPPAPKPDMEAAIRPRERKPEGPVCPACGAPGLFHTFKEIQGRPVGVWACGSCRNESLG